MDITTFINLFISQSRFHRSARMLTIVFILTILIFISTGCIARPGVKTVRITGEAQNRENDETRVYFINDNEPIIAILELANISKPAKLATEWRYLERGTVVYSTNDTVDKSGEYRIRLNRKTNESELGDYRVDVLIDGKLAAIEYFSIVKELPEPPTYEEIKKEFEKKYGKTEMSTENEHPILSDCTTASEVYGLTQAPKKLQDKFQANTPVVYLTMFMSEAPDSTKIRVDWYFLGKDGASEMLIIPAELETSGTRQLAFNMKPGTDDLPVGRYEARVFLNDIEFTRVPFEVVTSSVSETKVQPDNPKPNGN